MYVKQFQHSKCISSTSIKTNTNLCMYLVYNTVVRMCQFFCCGGKANLVWLTLFYSTLLTLTDRQNDGQRNKYTPFAWAGGTFFPVVLYVVSVFGSGGKKVLVQICMYYLEQNTVVVVCQFFGCSGKQFLVFCTYLVYNTVVLLCQFLDVAGRSSQNENIFLQ